MKWYTFLLAAFFIMGCATPERQKEVDDRRQAEAREKGTEPTVLGGWILVAGQLVGGLAGR